MRSRCLRLQVPGALFPQLSFVFVGVGLLLAAWFFIFEVSARGESVQG